MTENVTIVTVTATKVTNCNNLQTVFSLNVIENDIKNADPFLLNIRL